MMRPRVDEYATSFQIYVDQVPEPDVVPALEAQIDVVRRCTLGMTRQREVFAYGPGKWTVRQVVGHLNDSERVFGFRAFTFSRLDRATLPGFDENAYVEHARFNDIPLAELTEEFVLLRSANLRMFRTLREDEWSLSGVANGRAITVRALAFVMVGHVRHHLHLLKERYGIEITT